MSYMYYIHSFLWAFWDNLLNAKQSHNAAGIKTVSVCGFVFPYNDI